MPVSLQKRLHHFRNTRDLRAEMLALAAEVVKHRVPATLVLVDPKVQPDTARAEWDRLLPALDAEVRALLELRVQKTSAATPRRARMAPETWLVELERPNYRYEVVRQLLAAYLEDDGPQSVNGIVEHIGASQTPVRQALAALRTARVGHYWNPGVDLQADEVSLEVLARVNALPSTLRFRFAQGSQIKPPARL